jgi:D-xylose transport system permease protein
MTTKPSSVAPSEPSAAEGLSSAAVDVVPPEIVAESLGQYLSVMGRRIANGNTGALPVVLALVAISIGFEIWTQGLFLSPGNLVNLFIESMVFMTLGMAEIFVLLLGEIDLSAGYVLAVGAGIVALLVQKPGPNFAWWLAIIIALVCCGVTGAVWGALVSRLHLPSFVVTLAGLLIMWGVMLVILGNAGDVSISSAILSNQHTVYEIVNGNIPPLAGWISMVIVAVVLGGVIWTRDAGRRSRGLVAPPVGVTAVKVGFLVVAGAVVVAICNVNRGEVSSPVEGVPYVVPVVFAVLILWVILLQRTRFGRYVYAIGGNPDAARRAGISLPAIRTWAFVLSGVTAGFAGILYLSWQGGTSTNVNGGQYVLYGVAAAVIGGTSLFGGVGGMSGTVVGVLVIAVLGNGVNLLGVSNFWQDVVTGAVLLGAIILDWAQRRGRISH